MDNNNFGQELAKQTLDQIPRPNSNAKRIVGLAKEGGRFTGVGILLSDPTLFLGSRE